MADFLFDETVAEGTAWVLAELGHDVLTTRQVRSMGIDDVRQLILAADQAALALDQIIREADTLANRRFKWQSATGWRPMG